MTVLGFVEGPLWYAAAAIFTAGALWRIGGMLALPMRRELSEPRASAAAGAARAILQHMLPRRAFLRPEHAADCESGGSTRSRPDRASRCR